MLKSAILMGVLSALFTGAVQAGYLDLPIGRAANPNAFPGGLSIEAGYVTGDAPLGLDVGYENTAGRLNYQFSPRLTLFLDYGSVSIGDDETAATLIEGNPFGGGLFFLLPNQTGSSNIDAALKLSYHNTDLELANRDSAFQQELTVLVAELLISGKTPNNASLMWYANVGAHKLELESEASTTVLSETEFGFGGGLSLPLGGGQIYLGVDKIEEVIYGGGLRIKLR